MEDRVKILMFGWEFPPHNSGGLGTACYGITKALVRNNAEITFVLPRTSAVKDGDFMRILNTSELDLDTPRMKIKTIDSIIKPYQTPESYERERYERIEYEEDSIYGGDLYREVLRYAQEAKAIAGKEEFDIIHCHDWLTFPAGVEAKKIAEKRGMNVPLITHVHATEFDRTAGHPNQGIYDLERKGLQKADLVIAVSNYTKRIITRHYGIPDEKTRVVHNSIDIDASEEKEEDFQIKKQHRIVLFVGRMTIQKGPDHFLEVAKKLSDEDEGLRFVMVGSGDMFAQIVEKAAELGIGDRVLFTDYMPPEDVERAYRMADVFVMPSVSEPFGLTALEAIKNGTPVIVSKQSGVSEVLKNKIEVDFWDVDKISESILQVLENPRVREHLAECGKEEVQGFSWDGPARKILHLYRQLLLSSSERSVYF